MASPTKRRKIDKDNKSSPVSSKNLDYFFGRQKKDIPSRAANGTDHMGNSAQDHSELTDEQLAKKLQTEWDKEAAGTAPIPYALIKDGTAPASTNSDGQAQPPNSSSREPDKEDIYGAEDIPKGNKAGEWKVGDKPSTGPLHHPKSKDTLSLQSAGSAEDTISSTIPFDESPLTFDPTKYVPDLQKHWALEGNEASYALLTRCFVLVNSTQSRIKIVDTLVNFLRTIIEGDLSSLLPAVRIQRSRLFKSPLSKPCLSIPLRLKCHKLEAMQYPIQRSPSNLLCISLLTLSLGLACDKFNITSIHISRARLGWLRYLEGSEASMWA
jgi:DNA ligase-1